MKAEMDLATLRTRLAAIEHQRWADWQRWMHEQCKRLPSGELVIPALLVLRWERQIATPFEALSAAEQRSDLEQVDRYWPLVVAALERIPELGTIEELRQQVQRISRLAAEARDERDRWRQRAERVEAAARRIVSRARVGADPDPLVVELRAALADASAPSRPFVRTTTEVRPDHATKTYGLIQQAAAPAPGEVKGELAQPRVNGKTFRCPCGSNVFRKAGNRYTCNACGEEYDGTPAERPTVHFVSRRTRSPHEADVIACGLPEGEIASATDILDTVTCLACLEAMSRPLERRAPAEAGDGE